MTWDVTGLVYNGKNTTPPSTGTFDLQAFCLDETGVRLYVQNEAGSWPIIDQYTLSTPFDLTTRGAVIGTHTMTGHANMAPGTLWMGATGNRLYSLNNDFTSGNDAEMWELTLGVAYDVTSVTGTAILDISATVGTFAFAATMSETGSRLYALESNVGLFDGQTIHQWDIGTPWDITTAVLTAKTFNPSAQIATPQHIVVGNISNTLLVGDTNGNLWQYTMSTAGDIDTSSYDSKTYDLSGDVADIARMDLHVDACSTKLYSTGQSGGIGDEVLYQWDMGTAGGCAASPGGGDVVACTGTYVEGGIARLAIGSLSGLYWLGCTTVEAYLDGNVVTLEICDGKTTFPRIAARAAIGLGYVTDIETLDIEAPGPTTIQGGRKKITDVTTRFFKSRLPLIGPDFQNMVQMKQREDEKYGESTNLLSGDKTTNIPPDWNSHGRIAMRIKDPVPCTWLAIIPELEGEDG